MISAPLGRSSDEAVESPVHGFVFTDHNWRTNATDGWLPDGDYSGSLTPGVTYTDPFQSLVLKNGNKFGLRSLGSYYRPMTKLIVVFPNSFGR